jgi:hypothetical protein
MAACPTRELNQATSCDHLLVDTQEELSYTHPINKGHLIKPT